MQAHEAIKRPVLTEKTTFAMSERGQYSFEVDPRASKGQIKRAVEALYRVRVVGVRTQVRKGKRRRLRHGLVMEPTTKRALVRLAEGQAIEMF